LQGLPLLHEITKILDTMTICPPHLTQRGVVYALAQLDVLEGREKEN